MPNTPNLYRIAMVLVAIIAIAHFATQSVQSPPSSAPLTAATAGDGKSSTLLPTAAPLEPGAAAAASPERPAVAATLEPKHNRAPSAPNLTAPPLPVARPALTGTSAATTSATRSMTADRKSSTAEAAAPLQAALTMDSPVIAREFTVGAMTFELGPGVPLPAALLESESPLPPAVAAAKEGIAREFQRDVTDAVAQPNTLTPSVGKTWPAAKAKADAQFRAMFGDAAFNEWSMQAAREALPTKAR